METHEIVKLCCCHTSVDTGDDLLCDSNGVDMVGIKAVT